MKNLSKIFFFFSKNWLLKKYYNVHKHSLDQYGELILKYWITYKTLYDELFFLLVNTNKPKTKKYIEELLAQMKTWNTLTENELYTEFNEYSKIIYFLRYTRK